MAVGRLVLTAVCKSYDDVLDRNDGRRVQHDIGLRHLEWHPEQEEAKGERSNERVKYILDPAYIIV